MLLSSLALASARSILELAEAGTELTWRAVAGFFTGVITAAPLLLKPYHINPIQPTSKTACMLFPSDSLVLLVNNMF